MSGAVFAVNSADRTVGNNHDYQGSYSIKKAKEVEVKKLATGTTANVGYLNIFAKSNGLPYFKDENGMETPLVAGAAEVARVGAYNAGSHGSSGTRVILFDNAETAVGTGLTLTNDATNGTYVQVAASVTDDMVCLAEMSYVGSTSGTSVFGFQKTTTLSDEYTTSIDSGTASKVFGINEGATSAKFGSTSAAIPCTGGDIIRPMDSASGVVNVNSDRSKFSVTLLRRGTGSAGAVLTETQDCTVAIGGTTTAPTKGGGTVIDKCTASRRGDRIYVKYDYKQTTAGSAGSGTYLFPIPFGLTADTVKHPVTSSAPQGKVGEIDMLVGTSSIKGFCLLYDSQNVACQYYSDGAGNIMYGVDSSNTPLSTASVVLSLEYEVPISGWTGGFTGGGGKIYSARINNSGSCSVASGSERPVDWISAASRPGAGQCSLTISMATAPHCWMTGINASTPVFGNFGAGVPTTTNVTTVMYDQAGSAADTDHFVFCSVE
jgi:hypothetical protein